MPPFRWESPDEIDLVIDEATGKNHYLHDLPEGTVIESYWTKEKAFSMKLDEIIQKNRDANLQPFTYMKEGVEMVFVSDRDSIQGTQNVCLTKDPASPIPSPGGMWVLENEQMIPFTCGEFLVFAEAYFMRSSANYGTKKYHEGTIRAMLADPAFTAQDIRNYDCTVGWH